MGEKHSYAKLKRRDGQKVSVSFKDMLEVSGRRQELVGRLHELERMIEELRRNRAAIEAQVEELGLLWDDRHTAAIRTQMQTCAEEMDEAAQQFEAAQYDLTLLIGAADGVVEWLALNPDYNRVWSYNSTKYYYCKQTSSRSNKKSHISGDSKTLEFG